MSTQRYTNPVFAHAGRRPVPTAAGRPWFAISNAENEESVELFIYDEIGQDWFGQGVLAKEFAKELDAIPKGKKIILSINSPGGNVDDGIAIYNRLRARKEDVIVRIDGIAASIASVIALGGSRLEIPPSGSLMIHDPWSWAEGNADDMRDAADRLDRYGERLAGIYARKTGKTDAEMRDLMRAETYLFGQEAIDAGFADALIDESSEPAAKAAMRHDLSRFRRMPPQFARNQRITTQDPQNNPMKKTKILALLKQHGMDIAADATDEAIIAALDKLVADKKIPEADANALKQPEAPKSTPVPQPDAGVQTRIDALERRATEAETRARQAEEREITAELDAIVADNPSVDREKWLPRALKDRSVLADLRALPKVQPGGEPLGIGRAKHTGDPVEALVKDIEGPEEKRLAPRASLKRVYANLGDIRNLMRRQGQPRAANTLTNLTNTVLANVALEAFTYMLAPLRLFSTNFSGAVVQRGDKVKVFWTGSADSALTFSGSYAMQDVDAQGMDITIDKRPYVSWSLTMEDLYTQPQLSMERFLMQKGNKLGLAVLQDIWSLITAANYGSDAYSQGTGGDVVTVTAANFDQAEVGNLYECAGVDNWPVNMRGLVLSVPYYAALFGSSTIVGNAGLNGNDVLANARIRNLLGFEVVESNAVPANGENLTGFAVHPDAILVAMRAIMPPSNLPGSPNARAYTDAESGITIVDRQWFDPDDDTPKRVLECNYGYLKGNPSGIKRIKSS